MSISWSVYSSLFIRIANSLHGRSRWRLEKDSLFSSPTHTFRLILRVSGLCGQSTSFLVHPSCLILRVHSSCRFETFSYYTRRSACHSLLGLYVEPSTKLSGFFLELSLGKSVIAWQTNIRIPPKASNAKSLYRWRHSTLDYLFCHSWMLVLTSTVDNSGGQWFFRWPCWMMARLFWSGQGRGDTWHYLQLHDADSL